MLKIFNRYQKAHVGDPATHSFYQEWGQHDQVFCASTRKFSTARLPSLISLRYVVAGSYWHHADNTPVKMAQGNCLIADSGRHYSVEIDSEQPVTTVEVHYSHQTASAIAGSMACRNLDAALDMDTGGGLPVIERIERDHSLRMRMRGLADHLRSFRSPDTGWLEEQINTLLAESLAGQLRYRDEWARIDAARRATRLELYRRLVRSRDYLRSHVPKPTRVDELAKVATLSPYHFQRLYRKVFGISVHQDVVQHRLRWAQERISRGKPVKDVALDAGFAHASSFCRAYRNHFGHSPTKNN